MYSLLLVIIYVAFISLGLPDSLLGSGWPAMYEQLGVEISYAGIITMLISVFTIISSVFAAKITVKLGTGLYTAISVSLTALAMIGFSFSTAFWQPVVLTVPYGLGAGGVDASLNNYVALHYKSRHMSWLHCFWGVGTIISPYVMAYALRSFRGWQGGYLIVGLIQCALAVGLFLAAPLWKKQKQVDSSDREETPLKALSLKEVFSLKGIMLWLIGFSCYCALEQSAMVWASSYLAECRGLSAERAATFGSLFCIGITAGRLISGFVAEKAGDKLMIRIGLAIILIGTILIALPVNYVVALVGFVVVGLGCAPVYPSIIHATPDAFGKENSQSVIGMQMAFAYVGSTFMPPLFGVIAKYTDMSILPYYVMLFALIMVALTECFYKIKKKQSA